MNFIMGLLGQKKANAAPAYNVEAPPHKNAINVRVNNAPAPAKPNAPFTGVSSSAVAPRINNASPAAIVGGRRSSRKNSRKNSRKDRKSRRSSRK